MIKKKVKNEVIKEQHYCGDCGHGMWYFDHRNLDLKNKLPICCRCKYSEFSKVRSEYACKKWKSKDKNELSITPKGIEDGRNKG